MKTHHVWWPHMDREPLFNPFVPVTQQRVPEPEPINAEEEQPEDDLQSDEEQDRSPPDEK
jgi:hypothetical protein